jgi:hypothetical protein
MVHVRHAAETPTVEWRTDQVPQQHWCCGPDGCQFEFCQGSEITGARRRKPGARRPQSEGLRGRLALCGSFAGHLALDIQTPPVDPNLCQIPSSQKPVGCGSWKLLY